MEKYSNSNGRVNNSPLKRFAIMDKSKNHQIIFFSSLFFNKYGNQSFLETIKQYSDCYDVIIITSSTELDGFYYSISEAHKLLPNNVRIYRTYNIIQDTFRRLIKHRGIHSKISTDLINTNMGILNILSVKLSSLLQIIEFFRVRIFKRVSLPYAFYAYEIGGVDACLFISRLYRVRTICRLQGTILYPYIVSNRIHDSSIKYNYRMYKKLKRFDVVTMTNDGTKGDQVLDYFGVPEERTLFYPNGVSSFLVNYKRTKYEYTYKDSQSIRLVTISRLIGWKRVFLSIEIMNKLINVMKLDRFNLTIYGYGSDDEKQYLNLLINNYRLDQHIVLAGPIEYSNIPVIFEHNDILISLYKYSNLSNSLLEAIFFNFPIITIYDEAILRILEQNNGFDLIYLFKEEKDEEELVYSITNFIMNIDIFQIRKKRAEMKDHNWNLTWEYRIEKEIALLDRIVKYPATAKNI